MSRKRARATRSDTSKGRGEDDDILLCDRLSNLRLRTASRTWREVSGSSLTRLSFSRLSMSTDTTAQVLEASETPCVDNRDMFARAVNQAVELCNNQGGLVPPLHRCEVCFCLGEEYGDDINRWVRFAITKGCKKLSLAFKCDKDCDRRNGDRTDFVLRAAELECAENARLISLNLKGCGLEPSFTRQFSSLEILKLEATSLKDKADDLRVMFSAFVNLKHLRLARSSLPTELCLDSLQHLQYLVIKLCGNLKTIKFSNVKLKSFIYISDKEIKFNPSGIQKLRYSVTSPRARCSMILPARITDFPKLLRLYVSTYVDWVNTAEFKTPAITKFDVSKVSNLQLFFHRTTKFDISRLIEVLRHFPYLRELSLTTCCSEDSEPREIPATRYCYRYLKKVEFGRYFGSSGQIDYLVYMLKHAPVLETMIIAREAKNHHPGNRCETCKESRRYWEDEEQHELKEQLHKISDKVTIILQ